MIVLVTTATIDQKFDDRLVEYRESYSELLKYVPKSSVHLVECVSQTTPLSNLGSPIFYSCTHKPEWRNKGALELLAMRDFVEKNLGDREEEECVIKLTGRYTIINNFVFRSLTDGDELFDFVGRLVDNETQIFTGLFSMKLGLLRKFVRGVEPLELERSSKNIEKYLKEFLEYSGARCNFIIELGVKAPIFGTGEIDLHYL